MCRPAAAKDAGRGLKARCGPLASLGPVTGGERHSRAYTGRAIISDYQIRSSFSAITKARKQISQSVIGPEGPVNSKPKALNENEPAASAFGGKARSKIATTAKAAIAAAGRPMFWAGADPIHVRNRAPFELGSFDPNAAMPKITKYPAMPTATTAMASAGAISSSVFTTPPYNRHVAMKKRLQLAKSQRANLGRLGRRLCCDNSE
jgi:hypothetical protein